VSDEDKSLIDNGCGPWWMPRMWKDGYFADACTIHDLDYNVSSRPRLAADRFFRTKMLEKAGDNKVRVIQAWIYYALVRLFGWTTYKL